MKEETKAIIRYRLNRAKESFILRYVRSARQEIMRIS
jgi:hypothetical protein